MLIVGFQRVEGGRIMGHAWVVVDGKAVIDAETNIHRFSPAFGFGVAGAPLHALAEA
jgi:hypothetical protein